MRTGLWLCAGGEFGFVLLAQILEPASAPPLALQTVLAALVLSMLLAPLIVQYSNRIVMRFAASEWLLRSMQLTRPGGAVDEHRAARGDLRLRPQRPVSGALHGAGERSYVALDLDPERVREAAAAGETVVYGDAARRETLVAAGITAPACWWCPSTRWRRRCG
jgi:CPA2 family monovalent cation:H+ antiporter-2